MVVRLRNSGKAGVVAIMVAVALVGSAVLAYAWTAPSGGAYPVTAVSVAGHGTLGTSPNNTDFGIGVTRKSTGVIKGKVVVRLPKVGTTRPLFKSSAITSVTTSGDTASITADGSVDKVAGFHLEISVTDNSPDMAAITLKQGVTTVYSTAGALTHGRVTVKYPKK